MSETVPWRRTAKNRARADQRRAWLRENWRELRREYLYNGCDQLCLLEIARRMQKDGLYAPTTYLNDVLNGLRWYLASPPPRSKR